MASEEPELLDELDSFFESELEELDSDFELESLDDSEDDFDDDELPQPARSVSAAPTARSRPGIPRRATDIARTL